MKKSLFSGLIAISMLLAVPAELRANTYTFESHPRTKLGYVGISLGKESQEQVSSFKTASSVVGAMIGLGVGYLLNNHTQNNRPTPELEKLVGPAITAGLGCAAGYFCGQSYATYWAPEKVTERTVNNLISISNHAIAASEAVGLDAATRAHIHSLPFDLRTSQGRLAVYQGLPIETSDNPISRRVNYAQNIATKVNNERSAVSLMTRELLDQVQNVHYIDTHEIVAIARQNKQHITALNALISDDRINRWCSYIRATPESKCETMVYKLPIIRRTLAQDEEIIRWHLTRLAALRGCKDAQYDLSTNRWTYVQAKKSTNYLNNEAGRKARAIDIAETKDEISKLIQAYQSKIDDKHNAQIIEYHELKEQIPSDIVQFIRSQKGTLENPVRYRANRKLLDYTNHLRDNHTNHNNGEITWVWIIECFGH